MLDNDVDKNGKGLTVESVSDPSHGSANINEDSSVTYSLEDTCFNGEEIFSYTIRDENNETDAAQIGIKVQGSMLSQHEQPAANEVSPVPTDQVPPLPDDAVPSPPVDAIQPLQVEQSQANQSPVVDAGVSMTVDE